MNRLAAHLGFPILVAMVVGAGASAACGGSVTQADSTYTTDSGTSPETGGSSTDLPCDVANAIASCTSCHSNPPISGTPIALVSYADLASPSTVDSTMTNAQRAVVRMKATTSPMPPAPAAAAAAADIATLETWIAAGMPKGTCGTPDGGPSPYDTPPICTSGRSWTGGDRGSSSMRPGGACISCHSSGDGPQYAIAGTVYPSAHEPDDCNSVLSGPAVVVVTDSAGKVYNLNVNAVGNFYYTDRAGTFAPPYTAKVQYQGRERAMVTPQTDGDCNKCHTQTGTSSAPGRIMLP